MTEQPPRRTGGGGKNGGAWWREDEKPPLFTLPSFLKKWLAPRPKAPKPLKPWTPKLAPIEIKEAKKAEKARQKAEIAAAQPARPPRRARNRTGKRLIVTADDFGASIAVNEAVEQAHRHGILTAASLMVAGEAAADAVARAKAMPGLGVGLHIVLVEGKPILPPDLVPDLVDGDGFFRTDMAMLGAEIFFRPSVRAQVYDEIEAQFRAFAATGLTLDHVNAHKHFHLHPTIAGLILEIGADHGLTAARAPFEPPAIINAIEPAPANFIGRLSAYYARSLGERLRGLGVTVPDQVFGLAWSGALTRDRLAALIDTLPQGLTEIYTHPATGPYSGAAPGYLYAEELAALTDPAIRTAAEAGGVKLGAFADFQ